MDVLHKVLHRILQFILFTLLPVRMAEKSELPNNLHESFPYQMSILCKHHHLYSSTLWSSGIYSLLVVADCATVTHGINLANSVKKWQLEQRCTHHHQMLHIKDYWNPPCSKTMTLGYVQMGQPTSMSSKQFTIFTLGEEDTRMCN